MAYTEQQIQEGLLRQQQEDLAARKASAEVLPGPLRDVFAVQPEIKVGKWSVRPFYDLDFEILQSTQHPLYEEMMAGIEGRETRQNYLPRGQSAWTLFYMMTRDPEKLDEQIKADGLPAIAVAAKKEFGRLQLGAIMELYKAVVHQIQIFSSTAVAYGTPTNDKEGASEQLPPSLTVVPPTDSAGSLTSAVG